MISGSSRISESDCVTEVIFHVSSQLLLGPNELDILFIRNMLYLPIICSFWNLNLLFVFFLAFLFIQHGLFPFSPCFLDAVRKSVSEASISSPHTDPPVHTDPSEFSNRKLSVKSRTCQDLGSHSNPVPSSAPLLSERAVGHT